jgi:hypothetical protein
MLPSEGMIRSKKFLVRFLTGQANSRPGIHRISLCLAGADLTDDTNRAHVLQNPEGRQSEEAKFGRDRSNEVNPHLAKTKRVRSRFGQTLFNFASYSRWLPAMDANHPSKPGPAALYCTDHLVPPVPSWSLSRSTHRSHAHRPAPASRLKRSFRPEGIVRARGKFLSGQHPETG